jgi:ABC-2 type transport system permease protein
VTAALLIVITVLGLYAGPTGAVSAQMADQLLPMATGADKVVTACIIGIATLFFVVLQITQYAYLVDCLYAERKDRSILFWKSLPLSDAAVVASKLLTVLVVMPLFALGASLITEIVIAAAASVRLGLHSDLLSLVWAPAIWIKATGFCLFTIVAVELWALPLMAWVMLTSAVAPRSPALFAILIPMAIALIERLLLGSHVFFDLFVARMGVPDHAIKVTQINFDDRTGQLITADHSGHWADPQLIESGVSAVFGNPALWWGLLAAAVLLAIATEMRRRRDPSA